MTPAIDEPDLMLAQRRLRITQFSVDHAVETIFWITSDARIIYVNEQAARSLGYTREELLSLRLWEIDPLFPEEAFQRCWSELQKQGGLEFESVHRRRDGSEFPVWVTASFYSDGETEVSFASVRDLSEKRAVELALRRVNEDLELRVLQRTAELAASEARYQDLYHNAPDMFASIDARTGRLVQGNRTLAETTGYELEDLIDHDLLELYDPACHAEATAAWDAFLSCGEVRGGELKLRRRDGSSIDVSVNMSAVRNPRGEILLARATFRDITDFKRTEQLVEQHRSELARVGRLATTGEMAAGLAHELNQPLYAVQNFTQGAIHRLEAGSLDHESLLGVLRDIASQTQRAADIIRSLRRYVGKREPQRALVDINESVRRVLRLMATEAQRRQTTVESRLAGSIPVVRCDAIQIEQVLINLILNGMESMSACEPGQRRICVSTRLTREHSVELEVADRGEGIAPGDAERIFNPFFTTKEEGIGLGLTISRTIVEAHGGRLAALPNPDRGTTMRFDLPF